MKNILKEICDRRIADMEKLGFSYGHEIPAERTRPVVPFLPQPGTILEVKRASPSKGDIAPDLDSVQTAERYIQSGTSAISVLTEENYFKGTLEDLKKVASLADSLGNKVAVLRKDFLLEPEEIEIAYRCGADAVLLIARILELPKLLQMAEKAFSLGISILLELRDEEAVIKAFEVLKIAKKMDAEKQVVLGVNSRDLKSFTIDMLIPLKIKCSIEKKINSLSESERPGEVRIISESGILSEDAAAFTGILGFDGILIGEAVAKDPVNAKKYVSAFVSNAMEAKGNGSTSRFWKKIAAKLGSVEEKSCGPLVKICGITNEADAAKAVECGADLLGFVFCKRSPRNVIDAGFIEDIDRVVKIGVITELDSDEGKHALDLVERGVLDALQLHGFSEKQIKEFFADEKLKKVPHYFAENLSSHDDLAVIELLQLYGEPRILVDARSGDCIGGTGTAIPSGLVEECISRTKLWLAGGLNCENISSVCSEFAPELVDASSGLEESKGKKSSVLIEKFFTQLHKTCD